METLERLRHRIETTTEMQSVVRTMKGLAAVNIRAFETAAHAVEHYVETVESGLQILLSQQPDFVTNRDIPRNSKQYTGVIAFGSEQGLCGSFNRIAFDRSKEVIATLQSPTIAAAGIRIIDLLNNDAANNVEQLPMPASVEGITDCVTDALILAKGWLESKSVSRILLVHNRLVTATSCEPGVFTLFPFDKQWLSELRARAWSSRCLPITFDSPAALLQSLIRHYLFIGLYRAFAESLAAEHSARLAAMQAAENNIEERLASLQLNFHQQRQATVTEELLDVVSGFEALNLK